MSSSELDLPLRRSVLLAAKRASQIVEKHGHISAPIWHAIKSDGQPLVIGQFTPDRETQLVLLRTLFELQNVVRYIAVCEAWVAKVDLPAGSEEPKRGAAVNHPNRYEVLLIHGEDIREGLLIAQRKITRDDRGRPTLGELIIDSHDDCSGAMIGLLPRKTTTH